MSTSKIAVVDFEFLLFTKDIVLVNEATVLDYNTNITETFHIRCGATTLEYVKNYHAEQLAYNKSAYHGIPYEYGSITYPQLCQRLICNLSQYDVVAVKGTQNVTAIKRILLSNVPVRDLDIGVFPCPSMAVLTHDNYHLEQTSCDFHEAKFRYCTAFKIKLLENWIRTKLTPALSHIRSN
jgi:hypothetical protein